MANINRYDIVTVGTASSQGDGTTSYYFSMQDYAFFTLQIEDTAGASGTNTYTVEASLTGTAYQDVTSALFDVDNATADTMFVCDTPCPFRTVKVKVVRSGDSAATDGAWTIVVKRSA